MRRMSSHPIKTTSQRLQGLLKQGLAALAQGRAEAASACAREALQLQPDLVEGHFLVGLIALELRDRKTAFSAFGSVTRLEPAHAAAWAQLAKLFIGDGQLNRADAALEHATSSDPRDPLVCDLIGTIYSRIGEHGTARVWYQKANQHRPGHGPFMLNLANNAIYHGEIAAAEALLEQIIAAEEDSPQAHWALSGARRAADHSHIEQMQGLLAGQRHHPRLEAFYHYAIGKELEDLEEWGPAFEAFSRGARARRQTVEYDEAAEIAMFECLEARYTPDWLASGPAGHDSTAPIFVLGQPRTGTTLIDRIIGSHSEVHSAGELQQFGLAIRRLSAHKDPRRFSRELFESALDLDSRRVGGLYLESTRRVQGGEPRFLDKLPQNYLYIPHILKALPRAKIVHLTRDARDACFASYKQLFADAYLHSYDLEEMARHHCRYRHLMEIWRERFPGRFLDISYEATVTALEPNVRRLLDYLELPWEDACLNFHAQEQAVSTASAVQVREPVHTRSVGRWRHYEKELVPMLAVLRKHGINGVN